MQSNRKKKRLTKEQRHAQLLECAIQVAANKGLGQTAHADVAAEAGVGVANVFRYFPNRSALIRSIVEEVGRFYREQSDQFHSNPNNPHQALRDHLIAFEDSIDIRRHYAAVWLQWGASVQNDCGIWDLFNAHNEYLVRTVSKTIRQAQPESKRREIALSKSRAQSIIGIAFALTMLKFSDASEDAVARFMNIALDDLVAI